jgi:hypothetical protein
MKNSNLQSKFIALFLGIAMIFSLIPALKARAAISSSETMPIIYTSSIDNMQYPSTSQFTTFSGTTDSTGVGRIVVTEPTIIKSYLHWDTSKVSDPIIWISQDAKGIDIIGTQATLSSSTKYLETLLDPGTYYFNYTLKSADSKNSYIYTTIGVCIIGQVANSTEDYYSSSKTNPNSIKFGQVETGFLSYTAPIDYYSFTLKEKSIISIDFNFQDLKDINLYNASCILKNSMDANIIEQRYNANGAQYNTITKILDPGKYYVVMKGATTITTLNVKKTPYIVTSKLSTRSYTKGNVKVSLNIPFEYSEILVTEGNVPKSKITDYYTWMTYGSTTTFSLNDNTYKITKNGTYTFRIFDYLNNYYLYTVKVTNIDKTAPTVSGVSNGKTYTSTRTIRFIDSLSGVKTAKLNGKVINSGKKVSAKGSYTLVVTDNVGNVKTVKFKI